MSGSAIGRRALERIAQGITRTRLLQPIIVARPSLVVLSAPSGFGKTVLAAQLATSAEFPEVVWVDGAGHQGSILDSMQQLSAQLRTSGVQDEPPATCEGLAGECAAELARRPDEHCMLVVVDNAGWATDAGSVDIFLQALSDAPRGSVVVVTTRAECSAFCGAWFADSHDLGMADPELCELFESVTGRILAPNDLARLVDMSDRHPALASLLVRRWAMDHRAIPGIGTDGVAARLIQSLVDDQLSADERIVLDFAAVLGSGSSAELAVSAGRDDAEALLRRISACMPLVTASGSGKQAAFDVHQLVADALCSSARLATEDPDGFVRIVRTMLGTADFVRAIELTSLHQREDLTAECLIASGAAMLCAGHHGEVSSALDSLPAIMVASDPRLLLLKAECAWEGWDGAAAGSAAQLALHAAEAVDDASTAVRSRLLLARIRALSMDHAGVVAEVTPLLGSEVACLDADAASDAVVALLMASTFLGDRVGLSHVQGSLQQLLSSRSMRASSAVRLRVAQGLSLGLLEGDWSAALECFAAARSACGSDASLSAVVTSDILVAMLSLGLLAEVEFEIGRLRVTTGLVGDTAASFRLIEAFADCLGQRDSNLRQAVHAAVDQDAGDHDQLSLATTLIYSAAIALAMREAEWGLSMTDRAVRAALVTGSPILVLLAELAQAAASVLAGDTERGRGIAMRVLPQVQQLEAPGHVLQARLLLAQTAYMQEDLSQAVQHLDAVSGYIREKSPVLTVASYLRAFPALLGPLALAMGVEHIPARVLGLLPAPFGPEALKQAAAILTPEELKRLQARVSVEVAKSAPREGADDLADAVCRVRVLGGLEVIAPHGKVADRDWGKRKARVLFAMLVARAGTDVPRGEITEYLWPEMEESRALNNFYVVWSAMKRALTPHAIREVPCPFVEHVHGVCRIVTDRVVTDVDEFDAHLALAREARDKGDADAELAAIRAAEQVYRGDVLPADIYDDWFSSLRLRMRHSFEDAMLRAAQILDERGEPHAGLSMLRRPMEHDSLREDFYQAALRLQISSGQRSAAIGTYMSCRSRLVEELGIDPSRETTSLYEQVLGMEDVPT